MQRLALFVVVTLGLFAGTPAFASRVNVSCYYPNSRMAGARTPNLYNLPVVANKTLAFGTIVRFTRGLVSLLGIVKDRGPFVKGRSYDLDCKMMSKLGISGVGTLDATVVGR